MKKFALLCSLGLILAFPATGHCEATAPADAGKAAPPPSANAAPPQAEDLAQFPQRKAEIIKGMEDRIAMLEKAKSCVEAAKDHETLKECIPHRGGPGGMGMGMGRPGGMGPAGMMEGHRPGGPGMQPPGPGSEPSAQKQ